MDHAILYNGGMADIIELKLTGIAHGGEALGTVGKRVIFVAYALPGETVRVQVVEEHNRWMRGTLLEVLDPSPYRQEPECPYFGPGRCGGCQWQHIQRKAQLDYKKRIVRDQLQRVGGLKKAVVRPTINPGPAWQYRTQMLFQPSGGGSLGLRSFRSYDVFPIDHCLVLQPDLEALYEDFNVEWEGLRSVDISMGINSGQRLVILRTQHDELPEIEVDVPVSIVLEKSNGEVQPLIGEPWYFETIAGQEYRFSAGVMRPSNPPASEALIEVVAAYLRMGAGHTLMDVYCGSGLFSLGFAGQVSLVIGIDEEPLAIEDCAFNCSHLDNVALHEGPPSQVLRKLQDPIDRAVLTPPAEGMGHRVAQNLARLGAIRVAYVAYNPATLARDVAEFKRAGYTFQEATPIDVAPQTYYVTTVALFTR